MTNLNRKGGEASASEASSGAGMDHHHRAISVVDCDVHTRSQVRRIQNGRLVFGHPGNRAVRHCGVRLCQDRHRHQPRRPSPPLTDLPSLRASPAPCITHACPESRNLFPNISINSTIDSFSFSVFFFMYVSG